MKNNIETARTMLKEWVNSRTDLSFFNGLTTVFHNDGSVFIFQYSAMKEVIIENTRFLLVATEHCGYHVFYIDDLMRWRYYES